MRAAFFIILTLVSLMLISGCEPTKEEGAISSTTPFIGGANALTANFISGAPPEFILDNGNSPFGIAV